MICVEGIATFYCMAKSLCVMHHLFICLNMRYWHVQTYEQMPCCYLLSYKGYLYIDDWGLRRSLRRDLNRPHALLPMFSTRRRIPSAEMDNQEEVNSLTNMSYDEQEIVPQYDNVLYCPSQVAEPQPHNNVNEVQQWTSSTYVSATPVESPEGDRRRNDDADSPMAADEGHSNELIHDEEPSQHIEDDDVNNNEGDTAAGCGRQGADTEELDISTPVFTQNQTRSTESERYDNASRLVRQYMGADVPARTTSNTRTGLKALCTFVCDLEKRPYMVNRNDRVEPPTGVFKEGRKILFSFNSMSNTTGYYPSGFDNWTEFEHKRVRHYLREFIIHYKKKMVAS